MNKNREKANLQKLCEMLIQYRLFYYIKYCFFWLCWCIPNAVREQKYLLWERKRYSVDESEEWPCPAIFHRRGVPLCPFPWVSLNMSCQRREAELKLSILNHSLETSHCLLFLLSSVKLWLTRRVRRGRENRCEGKRISGKKVFI